MHTWKWTAGLWEGMQLDFAKDHKQMLLVVMDVYARWPEIVHMYITTSVEALKKLFAGYGLPK